MQYLIGRKEIEDATLLKVPAGDGIPVMRPQDYEKILAMANFHSAKQVPKTIEKAAEPLKVNKPPELKLSRQQRRAEERRARKRLRST